MAGTIKLDGTTFLTKDASNNFTLDVGSDGSISQGTLGSGVVFPAGNIQQIQLVTCTAQQNFTSDTPAAVSGFNKAITVGKTGSKILVTLNLVAWGTTNSHTGNRCYTKITESVTSLDYWVSDIDGWTNTAVNQFHTLTFYYLHTHGQNAGTALTYTPKFGNGSGTSSGTKFNYFYTSSNGGDNRQSYMLLTELA
jgi:hypothetical protein